MTESSASGEPQVSSDPARQIKWQATAGNTDSRVMHSNFGRPLISALHEPHLPALQFHRIARSVAWVACSRCSAVVGESILDRVLNTSHHLLLEGKSYRPRRRPGQHKPGPGRPAPAMTRPSAAARPANPALTSPTTQPTLTKRARQPHYRPKDQVRNYVTSTLGN